MADPTPSWIPSWLQPLWEVFDQAAPLSKFVTIATWVLAGAGAAYLLIGRRLGHKTAIIKHLEKKLAAEQKELLAAAGQSARLEAEKAELSERLAETAIAAAQREWRDGNPKLARLRLQGWLDREGGPSPISSFTKRNGRQPAPWDRCAPPAWSRPNPSPPPRLLSGRRTFERPSWLRM